MLNFYNTRQFWEWMYVDVKAPNGNMIKVIRHKPEHWAEAKAKFPELGAWDNRIALADFMRNTYKDFFVNKGNNIALANRVATLDINKERAFEKVTNLELHNKYRKEREASNFEYYEGWFAKVPKLLEEYGGPTNMEYWQQVKRKNFTIQEENEYEDLFNNVEALPMKYLGTETMEISENYSMSAEWSFMKFVRMAILKEELDDVFAFGKGVQMYLENEQKRDPSNGFRNTIEYMKKQMDMQIRGVKQREFQGGFVGRNGSILTSKEGHLYKIDWLKAIRSFKNVAAGPVMWLKPFAGSANTVFTYMATLKDGLKNSILNRINGKIMGVDSPETNQFVEYTASDII